MLDNRSEIRTLVEGLQLTVGSECACVADLVNAQLILLPLVGTAALSSSAGMVSDSISSMCVGFSVKESSSTPGPSSQLRLIKLWSCPLYKI